jgi:chromosome segregation ATPase
MTVVEGFKWKSASQLANEAADKVRKEFKGADTNINNTINTNLTNLTNQIKAIPTVPAGLTADSIKTQISTAVKALPTQAPGLTSAQITDNIKTQISTAINAMPTAAPGMSSTELTNLQNKINTLTTNKADKADFTTAQTNIKASEDAVNTQSTNITNLINEIKPRLTSAENAVQQVNTSSADAITKIAGSIKPVTDAVEANKAVSTGIDTKATNIKTQIDSIATYVNQAKQYSDDIDKKLAEFQKSSALLLAQMKLQGNVNTGTDLGVSATTPPTKQGFQNMGVSIGTAYNGQLQLEGFSTVADSAYLNNADLFTLEKNVVSALKEFNEAYYAYRKCLHDTPTISSTRCATELGNLTSKKDAVITAVNAFSTTSDAMKAKMASTSTSTDNGKRITQAEFEKRHDEIKTTATTVSALRAELDMKMANLLDNSKGPFPEAKNKYNAENYMTIGWSILATSVLYYVFVEMK